MKLKSHEKWGEIPQITIAELSGEILTLRDGTLKKYFVSEPHDHLLLGKVIYFCGPTPSQPGKIIGSAGPTTSGRMEPYFELLGKAGVKALIGKGNITESSQAILKKFGIFYFSTIGGAGAFLAQKVKSSKIIKFPELGAEAIFCLEVEDFPLLSLKSGR